MNSTLPKAKKKKGVKHVTYNQKEFLAKNDLHSAAMIQTRVLPEGTAVVRISDCNNSIRLWNDLNDKNQHPVLMEKLDTLINHLCAFRRDIEIRTNSITRS